MAADIVLDVQLAAPFDQRGFDLRPPEAFQHRQNLFLVARAVVTHRARVEQADVFLGKQAHQERGDRLGQFGGPERRRQMQQAVPAVGILGIRVGQFLQEQSAGEIAGRRQDELRRLLFRLGQIVLENGREAIAGERHDALIRIAGVGLQGQDKLAVAQQLAESRRWRDGIPAANRAPQAQLLVAIGQQQRNEAMTLQLDRQPAGRFQVAGDQRGHRRQFAEQRFDRRRIVAAGVHLVPAVAERYHDAADVEILEQEAADEIHYLTKLSNIFGSKPTSR